MKTIGLIVVATLLTAACSTDETHSERRQPAEAIGQGIVRQGARMMEATHDATLRAFKEMEEKYREREIARKAALAERNAKPEVRKCVINGVVTLDNTGKLCPPE